MSASTVLILFLVAMVISIVVGNKFNAIGLLSMTFAYIIGVFLIGMKASAVVATFPAKILFTIIGICWLFGYANENGTLRQITLILVYKFRKYPSILPWVFFFIAGLITMTGASPYAPNAVLMPIIISICLSTNMNPLFGSLMVNIGSYLGSQVPWGQGANIQRGVLEAGIHAGEIDSILWNGFITCALFALVSGVLTFVLYKGWRAHVDNVDFITMPEPMNAAQKKTFALILILIVLMVIPSLMGVLGVAPMKALSSKLDISLVCITLAMVAALLNLADAKTVVNKHIPWNTLMMLAGVSMLVGVATEGGAVDLIGSWIGGNVPQAMIVPMFVLLAGFMSVFAAGASVVAPTLFALVPALAASAPTLNYHAVYAGIAIGANASAVSPFSGGGSLTLANIKQDEIREKMFLPLIIAAAVLVLVATVLGVTGLYGLL
ncbi:SLC13 family permease [Intestinimonas sp.]|uniref:SLC13 family permease n=1 Tax=Intestinimonas sp. TaxID=1965293 RepID=UPI002636DA45|nr:SLC13 family permease [Intestinimonas sp.]